MVKHRMGKHKKEKQYKNIIITLILILSIAVIPNVSKIRAYFIGYTSKTNDLQIGELEDPVKYDQTAYSTTKNVNVPNIKTGMTPIKFSSGSAVETTESDSNWYSYNDVTETGAGTSNWANVQTDDGSMWVWLPCCPSLSFSHVNFLAPCPFFAAKIGTR